MDRKEAKRAVLESLKEQHFKRLDRTMYKTATIFLTFVCGALFTILTCFMLDASLAFMIASGVFFVAVIFSTLFAMDLYEETLASYTHSFFQDIKTIDSMTEDQIFEEYRERKEKGILRNPDS